MNGKGSFEVNLDEQEIYLYFRGLKAAERFVLEFPLFVTSVNKCTTRVSTANCGTEWYVPPLGAY